MEHSRKHIVKQDGDSMAPEQAHGFSQQSTDGLREKCIVEVAVAMWNIVSPQNWTTDTIGSVLETGEKLYKKKQMNIDTESHISIQNYQVALTNEESTVVEILEQPDNNEHKLSITMNEFFRNSDYGILNSKGVYIGITKHASQYWVFNPYSINRENISRNNLFDSVNDTVKYIYKNVFSTDSHLRISKLRCIINCENNERNDYQKSLSHEEIAESRYSYPSCDVHRPTDSLRFTLEDLRAVHEPKKKSRKHKSKKRKTDNVTTNFQNHSESTARMSEPHYVLYSSCDLTEQLESKTEVRSDEMKARVQFNEGQRLSTPLDGGFEFGIVQEHSEGEDSGYAECPSLGDELKKNLHQKRHEIEAEIQHRLQREVQLLRQQMEMRLHAEKLRIEQQLRQELLQKESTCVPKTLKRITEPEPEAPTLPKQLPLHQYEKTKGFADMSGEQYEVKMAALMFLFGFNYTDKFLLATNLQGAGAFDDIIFQYEGKINDYKQIRRICFIQLKHKQKDGVIIPRSELLSLQGAFSLRKLYASFREVSGQFCMKANHKIFNGRLEDCEFCLYTNAQIDRKPMNECNTKGAALLSGDKENRVFSFSESADTDVYTLFQDLGAYKQLLDELCRITENEHDSDQVMIKEKIKRFIEEHPNKEITPKLNRLKNKPSRKEFQKLSKEVADVGDVSTYNEFLNKLTVLSNQAGKQDLDKVIEREIEIACGVYEKETKVISRELLDQLQEWRRSGNEYLTETATFWRDILQSRINRIHDLGEPKRKKFKMLDIRFQESHLKKLVDIIHDNKIINVISNGNTTILSELKVTQAQEISGSSCIVLSFEHFLRRRNEVLSIWPSRWCDTLVLECEIDNDSNFESLRLVLGNKILLKSNHRLLVVSRNSMTNEIGNNCVEFLDHTNLNQLDNISQARIMNRKVIFQEQNVRFGSLFNDTAQPINAYIISQLLRNDQVVILGDKLLQKHVVYISRTLECKIFIKPEILSNNDSKDIFAVSGITEKELSYLVSSNEEIGRFLHHSYYSSWFYQGPDNCRFIVFETENSDLEIGYEELCERFAGKSVHLLRYEDELIRWVKSCGDVLSVSKYIDAEKSCASKEQLTQYITAGKLSSCRPNNVNDVDDRVVLISAEPGMGKSTLLTHLAHETKAAFPSTWVLRINLNDNSKYLFENSTIDDMNVRTAIDFLASCMNMRKSQYSHMEHHLLRHCLHCSGKIIILLDGFDEISPIHAKTTATIIRILTKTKISKIWVTSRPIMRRYLQKELNVVSFTLQPFSERDQKTFLQTFWKSHRKEVDDNVLNVFVKKFISVTKKTLHDKNIAGIPLHTTMLAEAYEKLLVGYNSSVKITLPERLDLLELYDTFVEKKFHIYCKEKNKMDVTKAGINDDLENMRESFMNNHMNAALAVFFSSNELFSLLDRRSCSDLSAFITKIKDGKEKTGIIVQVNSGIPHFIHRTFAEYFVAKWLAQNYSLNRKFLIRILFMQHYDVISNIFNHIMARGFDLHVAVLNHDKNVVQDLLKNPLNINITDKGGRTALHLAAAEYSRSTSGHCDVSNIEIIAGLLLSNGIRVDVIDNILGWKALDYADMLGASWKLIERLLQVDVSSSRFLYNTRKKLKDREFRDKALCEIAEQGHVQLVSFLLRNGATINGTINFSRYKVDQYRLLHIAARYGRLELVSFLVKHGANILEKDRWGATALHRASQFNRLQVVQYLFKRCSVAKNWLNQRLGSRASPLGDIVNIGDEDGDTPLHYAARGGALDVVQYLIEDKLADINASNSDGDTALDVAERCVLRDDNEAAVAVVSFIRSFSQIK